MAFLSLIRALRSALLIAAATTTLAHAATPDREAEMRDASSAAKQALQHGPLDIPFAGQATLKLPDGYAFIPQPQADQLLKAMGNGTDPSRLGVILPPGGGSFVVPRFIASGYIKDDEAKDWKADELLDGLKQGTAESNKERTARGIPEMEIVGWAKKPTYEQPTHRLVWAIETKDKGQSAEGHGTNYNTYVLGREGYLSMNLVSSLDELATNKPYVENLLSHTSFDAGKTYADYQAGKDKLAQFGIAALVTGVVAKKLGLFAMIAAFGLKFAKVIAVAVLAAFAGARKFFKRA